MEGKNYNKEIGKKKKEKSNAFYKIFLLSFRPKDKYRYTINWLTEEKSM